jgi:hypothetical protein
MEWNLKDCMRNLMFSDIYCNKWSLWWNDICMVIDLISNFNAFGCHDFLRSSLHMCIGGMMVDFTAEICASIRDQI